MTFTVVTKNGFVYIADESGKKVASMLGTEADKFANAYLFAAAGDMRETLEAVREFVAEELTHYLECCCIIDKKSLEPMRHTLDEDDREFIEGIEAKLAAIDAALKASMNSTDSAEGKQS